jgi:predicted amidohydrolase
MSSGSNKAFNFTKAKMLLGSALKEKPDVVCFPEVFLYSGTEEFLNALDIGSEEVLFFREQAKKFSVNLVLGSVSLKTKGGKVTNSCLVIDRKGKIVFRYDKMFMYDVVRPELVFRESDSVVPGKELGLCKIDGVTVGLGICVDLRYPEYFRALVFRGAKAIFLPSSFRKATGSLAWNVLTKARAIENQVYFCACDTTGSEGNRERCGRTRIVSFNGEILSEVESEEWYAVAELDFDKQENFRKEFPILQQKKFEIKKK